MNRIVCHGADDRQNACIARSVLCAYDVKTKSVETVAISTTWHNIKLRHTIRLLCIVRCTPLLHILAVVADVDLWFLQEENVCLVHYLTHILLACIATAATNALARAITSGDCSQTATSHFRLYSTLPYRKTARRPLCTARTSPDFNLAGDPVATTPFLGSHLTNSSRTTAASVCRPSAHRIDRHSQLPCPARTESTSCYSQHTG